MQRRKAELAVIGEGPNGVGDETKSPTTPPSSLPSANPPPPGSGGMGRHTRTGRSQQGKSGTGLWILFLAISTLAIATLMAPSTLRNFEDEIIKDAYKAEKSMESWLEKPSQFLDSSSSSSSYRSSSSATTLTTAERTEIMKKQPSNWVEGEKKLKQKLKVLAERQAQGLDLGTPILTRYLGEDIPAFVTDGMDEVEWKAKRDAAYERMRKEEEEWITNARKIMESEQQERQARRRREASQ